MNGRNEGKRKAKVCVYIGGSGEGGEGRESGVEGRGGWMAEDGRMHTNTSSNLRLFPGYLTFTV